MNYQDLNLAYANAANQEGDSSWEMDDIIDYPVAAVADLAVSVANSVTPWVPDEEQYTTDGLLDSMGLDDASKFYADHTTATELASFIGGIVIPGIGISKVLNAAKVGKLGTLGSPFQKLNNNIVSFRDEALTARKTAGIRSASETQAIRGMYTNAGAMALAENIVYEAGMVGLMNQHSFLEEYDAGDMLLGIGLGTAIGGGLIAWQARGLLKEGQIAIDAAEEAVTGGARFAKYSAEGMPLGYSSAGYRADMVEQQGLLNAGELTTDQAARVENYYKESTAELRNTLIAMHPDNMRAELRQPIPKEQLDELVDFHKLVDSGIDVFDPRISNVELLGKIVNDNPRALTGVDKVGNFTNKSDALSVDYNAYYRRHVSGDLDILEPNIVKPMISGKRTNNKLAPYTHKLDGTFEITLGKSTTMDEVLNVMALPAAASGKVKMIVAGNKQLGKDITFKLDGIIPHRSGKAFIDEALENKSLTRDSLMKEVNASVVNTGVVMDSWSGAPAVIDSIEARIVQGVADYKGYHPKIGGVESYNISNLNKEYDPTNFSVWHSDSLFDIANQRIGKYRKSASNDHLVDELNLPRLQGFRNAFVKEQQPFKLSTTNAHSNEITTLPELDAAINKARSYWVKELTAGGHSDLAIMKHTNTTPEGLALLRADGFDGVSLTAKMDTSYRYNQTGAEFYKDVNQIELKGKNVATYEKWEEYSQAHAIDQEAIRSMFKVERDRVINEVTAGGRVEGVKIIHDEILGMEDKLTEHLNILASPAVTGSNAVSSIATSFDHAFRTTGSLGVTLSKMGANLKTVANNTIDRMHKSVQPALAAINENNAARTAFYQLRQATDGLDNMAARSLRYDGAEGKFILAEATEEAPATYLKIMGSQDDWKVSGDIQGLMEGFLKEWVPVQDELYDMLNTSKRLQGARDVTKRGFWLPYGKIDEANIAYKINMDAPNDITVVRAKGADELRLELSRLRANNSNARVKYVTREDLGDQWNRAHKRAELDDLGRADASKEKSGVSIEGIPADGRGIQEVLDGVSEAVWSRSRAIVENGMPDTINTIKSIIKEQDATYKSSKGGFFQKLDKPISAAQKAYNVLMNYDAVSDSVMLKSLNNVYSGAMDALTTQVGKVFNKHNLNADSYQKEWDAYVDDLTKAGMADNNPFKNLTDYVESLRLEKTSTALENTQKINSVSTLFALRFFDLSHAAITAMSMPVILAGELSSKTYSNVSGKGLMPIEYQMRGIKMAMQSGKKYEGTEAYDVMQKAQKMGYTRAQIAETTEAFADLHLKPGTIDKMQNNEFMKKWILKPSDWMEGMVREVSYATGYQLAKDKFPSASKLEWEGWAHNFTNRTMGNYITKQRPTMFQGAFGSSIGLFQTFMLTMGQNLMRYAEVGDTRALSTFFGAQAGMFGMQSLPGYDAMNYFIGTWVNEDSHSDMNQFAERTFGSTDKRDMAEFMLYGFPSTLTQAAMYTRAELAPRAPLGTTEEGGISLTPPGWSAMFGVAEVALSTANTMLHQATGGGDIIDMGRALREGMATQSLFRPLARYTELAQGYSQDRTGQVVDNDTRDWGWFARIMGSRPLQEQALRQMKFDNSFYLAKDRDRRREYSKIMRSSIASDSHYDQQEVFGKYLNAGGSASGWGTIMNDAYMANMDNDTYAERITRDYARKGPMIDIISNYSN